VVLMQLRSLNRVGQWLQMDQSFSVVLTS